MNSDHHKELESSPPGKRRKPGGKSCLVFAILLIFGGVVVVGILAAVSIPAFVKYIKLSKASEATAIVGQLQHMALQYYEESGADGTCHFPPSADPVPAGEPCCEQVGPSDGEKWAPAPGTWSQEGWKALSFSMSDETYFAYQLINKKPKKGNEGNEDTDRLEIRAFSDFEPGGPRHTYSVTLEGQENDEGECVASAQAAVITNEFE